MTPAQVARTRLVGLVLLLLGLLAGGSVAIRAMPMS